MIKSIVRFYSTPTKKQEGVSLLAQIDDAPQIYYSFWVVASPWQATNSGIASILPLTTDSSGLPDIEAYHIDMSGGEEAAYAKAIYSLKSHGSLSGLGYFEQRES